jgi:hypothetical protein
MGLAPTQLIIVVISLYLIIAISAILIIGAVFRTCRIRHLEARVAKPGEAIQQGQPMGSRS